VNSGEIAFGIIFVIPIVIILLAFFGAVVGRFLGLIIFGIIGLVKKRKRND
jgi:hypothetical protein